MKIVVTQFITLDGVIEAPNEWSFPYWNDNIAKLKLDELMAADAHLLGRVTYEGFAAAWPDRTDEAGFADRMNNLPKYVVSTTLEKAEWNNSTILKMDVAAQIAELKKQPGGDILVAGSATLVETLIAHDLVDEYHLLTYPIVVGKGKRLFKDGSHTKLKLIETKPYDSGVVLLRYQPDRNG
jgi:dihydrofolate reductase